MIGFRPSVVFSFQDRSQQQEKDLNKTVSTKTLGTYENKPLITLALSAPDCSSVYSELYTYPGLPHL
jgi:hypothetical protein